MSICFDYNGETVEVNDSVAYKGDTYTIAEKNTGRNTVQITNGVSEWVPAVETELV
jgi:hypothetical protein